MCLQPMKVSNLRTTYAKFVPPVNETTSLRVQLPWFLEELEEAAAGASRQREQQGDGPALYKHAHVDTWTVRRRSAVAAALCCDVIC
jgi:hypothetical protein